ncbi:hypothetical protein F511_23141 [Dorcoceras hygrometricum]|uniref:Uncharacterized protein n=1 Tax=Dorcoceras hygrometricum TaxID=472368 RepID=A0A2Z7BIS5_9LAMI|nr:hypothetical protein F511_23141 [Dorcoceras hygrometricum]
MKASEPRGSAGKFGNNEASHKTIVTINMKEIARKWFILLKEALFLIEKTVGCTSEHSSGNFEISSEWKNSSQVYNSPGCIKQHTSIKQLWVNKTAYGCLVNSAWGDRTICDRTISEQLRPSNLPQARSSANSEESILVGLWYGQHSCSLTNTATGHASVVQSPTANRNHYSAHRRANSI